MQSLNTKRLIYTFAILHSLLLSSCEARRSANLMSSSISLDTMKSIPQRSNMSGNSWTLISRGGDIAQNIVEVSSSSTKSSTHSPLSTVFDALEGLKGSMKGSKADLLILLMTTALNTPVCLNVLRMSPILGYLILGTFFGPYGKNVISDIHTTEIMADIGIVFFLFEMGIHLNVDTLIKMKKDVFGLGLSQFLITSVVIAFITNKIVGLSLQAGIVIGGALALSSSAFVLQLLKDKNELLSQFGKSSFGVLLLQDLAVVPLMVITPLLAGSTQTNGSQGSFSEAISTALVQATIALTTIIFTGKYLINPFFTIVSKSNSQEAFVGAILSTVLGMSFLTEGLGLSNTLGAFLAGITISDTQFKHRVETEMAPFRGILVGLFFFTVGFEMDLKFIASNLRLVLTIVFGILTIKSIIATALCILFGLPLSTAQRAGLILSQGGEFAIVAFRLARSFEILDDNTTKLLLTCVSLTMALTPFLEEWGRYNSKRLENSQDGRSK